MSSRPVAKGKGLMSRGRYPAAKRRRTVARGRTAAAPHFANLDHARQRRRGIPEAIFCAGKTIAQIQAIVAVLLARQRRAFATRVAPEVAGVLLARYGRRAVHNAAARTVRIGSFPPAQTGCIGIVSAGTADIPVAEEAAETCRALGQRVVRYYDVGVAGLHRALAVVPKLRRCRVVIVIAGMDGALPAVVAGMLPCPVVGVPTSIGYGTSFNGLAALLNMLNSCAEGIGVVNIDNGYGAGCLAALINRQRR